MTIRVIPIPKFRYVLDCDCGRWNGSNRPIARCLGCGKTTAPSQRKERS